MRQYLKINDDWIFIKENVGAEAAVTAEGERISLPHTATWQRMRQCRRR